MRLSTRLIVTAVLLAPAILFPACGSSPNGSSPGSDAGAADGSIQTLQDSGGQSPDSTVSSGDAGGGSDTGATPVDSGTPSEDASNILGANCPAVDAAGFVEGPHGPLPTVAYSGGGSSKPPRSSRSPSPRHQPFPRSRRTGRRSHVARGSRRSRRTTASTTGARASPRASSGSASRSDASAASLYVDTFGQGTAPTGVDLDSFINDQIASAVAANVIPAPGPNSLYAFYFPRPDDLVRTPAVGRAERELRRVRRLPLRHDLQGRSHADRLRHHAGLPDRRPGARPAERHGRGEPRDHRGDDGSIPVQRLVSGSGHGPRGGCAHRSAVPQ